MNQDTLGGLGVFWETLPLSSRLPDTGVDLICSIICVRRMQSRGATLIKITHMVYRYLHAGSTTPHQKSDIGPYVQKNHLCFHDNWPLAIVEKYADCKFTHSIHSAAKNELNVLLFNVSKKF